MAKGMPQAAAAAAVLSCNHDSLASLLPVAIHAYHGHAADNACCSVTSAVSPVTTPN
jgi:hypothetical protein